MDIPRVHKTSRGTIPGQHMNTHPTPVISTQDVLARRATSQEIWAAGDYARIGTRLQPVGETLCEAIDLRAGERVLDVAAGNGNAALAAARCGGDVVATDFVPALLANAARRAEADGLPLRTQCANAEELPFQAGEFDVVLSTFGVMFAADPAAVARELLRVCRIGGRIGLASWTPQSFIADLFRTIRRHVPAPPGAASPMAWGDERGVRDLLGNMVKVNTTHRFFTFRYRSAEHFLNEFRNWYGPMLRAFAALPPQAADQLAAEILTLAAARNRADDGTLVIASEYLEVIAVRRGSASTGAQD